MKDLIANQLVKYLEARGVGHVFGLCGHTNIAVLAALSKSATDQVRQHAARADRRAHGGRLRTREEGDRRRAHASRAGTHQRRHRSSQRGAGLGADGRHRRRHPEPLLRQASAPGSESAFGRVAVRDLPALRQARLARRVGASVSRDHRKGIRAGRERPARAGAGRRADGHLLEGSRHVALRAAAAQHEESGEALARRGDRHGDRQAAHWSEEAGALRRRRHHARRCDGGAARARRSSADPGRAHADGQGRVARRPSIRPRHDGLLGHQVHQRAMPQRRLDPRSRHPLFRSRLQLVGAGLHVQFSADQADADRHRPGGDRPQLSGRDRRRRGSQAGARRF